MAFAKKRIDVKFTLANGVFAGGGNSYLASGLRTSCSIQVVGGSQQGIALIAIFGLPLSVMNQLSNVGTQWGKTFNNQVSISAGDDVTGMGKIFEGSIYTAMVDADNMPEVGFLVQASPGYFYKIKPATPLSIRGSADVAGMMSQIAKGMGAAFENNGVVARLASPYYDGGLFQQAEAIARDAGITWILDRGTLAIMNPGEPRKTEEVLISPQTGMIGYPKFNANQVVVRSLFNPAINFGGRIKIESDLTSANGTWLVNKAEYTIEAEVPKGRWDVLINAISQGKTVA